MRRCDANVNYIDIFINIHGFVGWHTAKQEKCVGDGKDHNLKSKISITWMFSIKYDLIFISCGAWQV